MPEKQFTLADIGNKPENILQVIEADHPLLSDSLLDKFRYETFENRPVVLAALYPFLCPRVRGPPLSAERQQEQQRKEQQQERKKEEEEEEQQQRQQQETWDTQCKTINKLHTDALVVLLGTIDSGDQKLAFSNDIRHSVCRALAAIFTHQPLPFTHTVDSQAAKGDSGEQISIHQMALKLNALPILMGLLRSRPVNRGIITYRFPTQVQAHAMQALMGLTTDVEAKKSMVRDGGIQLLIDCVNGCLKSLTMDRKNLDEEVIEHQTALLQHALQVSWGFFG